MMLARRAGIALIVGMMLIGAVAASTKAHSQPSMEGRDAPNVFDGILSDAAGSSEISTAQLKAALTDSSAIILDARPHDEYAISHIPGARAVPAKAGTTPALYVGDAAEIEKAIRDKTQPLILYCRRALGGVMQVEKPALLRLLAQDATSVLIDARAVAGLKPRLRNAVSIPLREASKAKDDGRLPMTDHNTRIFVVGSNGAEAHVVAEAIVHGAFHNVTFFGGELTDLPELLEDEEG
jgi:rhodanese-related sulfurtransferase